MQKHYKEGCSVYGYKLVGCKSYLGYIAKMFVLKEKYGSTVYVANDVQIS